MNGKAQYFKKIKAHLKQFGKIMDIDDYLIDQAAFCLEQLEMLQMKIRTNGCVTKTGSKSGYVSSYEAFEKAYKDIGIKLGLNPVDREKLKWEITKKKKDGFDEI